MVGLVLVSHSQTLAEGLLKLIRQMAPDAPVALAAGTENPDEPIGTDPMRVYNAIESVYSDDGVLILMDLGSAIMSAEAAIEFLEPAQQEQIYLCEAPLAEGGVAAAVAAAGGAPLERVMREARAALPAKTAQLEPVLRIKPDLPTGADAKRAPVHADAEITFTIPNPLGLHARPAARLVELFHRFDAVATLTNGVRTIDPASITQLLTLGVRQGDTITLRATGAESPQLLAAVQQLADANFGDAPDAPLLIAEPIAHATTPAITTKVSAPTGPLPALPASPGIALGPVHLLTKRIPMAQEQHITDVRAEQARLAAALQRAEDELTDLENRLQGRVGRDEAGIIAAQRLVLTDNVLRSRVLDQIATEKVDAAWAWQAAINGVIADYEAVDDEYLRRRAADVRDVGNRLLLHLAEHAVTVSGFAPLATPGILVADELTPSEAATLDPAVVLGVVTATGGVTGHASIIMRSLGIPAVTGVAEVMALVTQRQEIALDGSTGELWVALDERTRAALTTRRQRWVADRVAAHALAQGPAVTRDGLRVEVAANISSAAEVLPALDAGAEGVGLFRTEFLFMGRTSAPDEEIQYQAYRAAAEAVGDRPLLIRTLDVGGDKTLPYLQIPAEENPFLGWRGIRYCLDNLDLFRTQLRAILRASHGHRVQVMFPMVSTVGEVQQARALLAEEKQALATAGIDTADSLAIGIMIETPAAVLNARQLAAAVDFFSIGSNDLTQYLMAADRGNSRVAELIDPLQPPVIAAIARVAEAAQVAGIWVGVCGEIAGEPLVTPLLLGLGINELSMSAPAIGGVKAVIRTLEHAAAVELAHYLLTLPDAKAVRSALQKFAERGLGL